VSDPERWRTWTIKTRGGEFSLAFYPGATPSQGVRSTSALDAAVFGSGAHIWTVQMPELVITGDKVSVVSPAHVFNRWAPRATCQLPETLEELIDWARMVHAMHTQPS
jgi:hypothetical protein